MDRLEPEKSMKTCGCGRNYSAAEWKLLPYVGRQDDEVEHIELRNCPCGSTIGLVLWTNPDSVQPTEA
jgi:hypothetical protein